MDEYEQTLVGIIDKAKSENDSETVNMAQARLSKYQQKKASQTQQPQGGQDSGGFDVGEFMSGGISPEASVKRRDMLSQDTQPNFANTLVTGGGFGYGDEALAAILATLGVVKGDIPKEKFGEMYTDIQADLNAQSDAYSEENPVKGFVGEVAPSAGAGLASSGSIAGKKIPSLIEKFRQSGVLGAGTLAAFEAFVYGSGQGDALKPGENITPKLPLYGHVGDTTYEPTLDDPYLNQIIADVGGRALEGAKDIPLGFAGGVAGARLGDALTTGLQNKAAAKKMTREGFEDPETVPYALADPSQKRIPQQAPVEEFAPDAVPGSPGVEGDVPELKGLDDAQFSDTPPDMPFEQDPAELIPQRPEGLAETAKELASPFEPKLIKPSSAAVASHQDVNPNMLTNIREANVPTLEALADLTNTFKRYKKTDALGSNSPYKLIGKEFSKRIDKIIESNQDAMKIQREARETLEDVKGVQLTKTVTDIYDAMQQQFKKHGIDAEGEMLDFSKLDNTSPFSKSGTQKYLQDVWTDFLNPNASASKLHDLRRNIDLEINHKKQNMTSFDDSTTKLLKAMRKSIKDSLDVLSPKYAEANRVMSQNLKALENLEAAFPQLRKQYDLNDPDDYTAALEYVGQQLRLLDSNAAAAPKIERSIVQFNRLAEEYGGEFDIDISKLVRHHNLLKRQFGDKEQSIGGIFDSVGDKIVKGMGKKKEIIQGTKEILNPMLGKNDENAYQSVLDYIAEISKTHKTGGAK